VYGKIHSLAINSLLQLLKKYFTVKKYLLNINSCYKNNSMPAKQEIHNYEETSGKNVNQGTLEQLLTIRLDSAQQPPLKPQTAGRPTAEQDRCRRYSRKPQPR
jgi:hypothetical protein